MKKLLVEEGIGAVVRASTSQSSMTAAALLQKLGANDRGEVVQQLLPHANQLLELLGSGKATAVLRIKVLQVLFIGPKCKGATFGSAAAIAYEPSALEVVKLMLDKFATREYYSETANVGRANKLYAPSEINEPSVRECAVETILEYNTNHLDFQLKAKGKRGSNDKKRTVSTRSAGAGVKIIHADVDAILTSMSNGKTVPCTRLPDGLDTAIFDAIIGSGILNMEQTSKLREDLQWIKNRICFLRSKKGNVKRQKHRKR
jgi:hypothetical protein